MKSMKSITREPFFFLQEVKEAADGSPIFDRILECTPLLVWVQPAPSKQLYWYLNECKTLEARGCGLVEFYTRHGAQFLETIGRQLTDDQFKALTRTLETAPRDDWYSLARIQEPVERLRAAREAAIKRQAKRIQSLREAQAIANEKARQEALAAQEQERVDLVNELNDKSLRAICPFLVEDNDQMQLERAKIEGAFLPPMQPRMHQVDAILAFNRFLKQLGQRRNQKKMDQLLMGGGMPKAPSVDSRERSIKVHGAAQQLGGAPQSAMQIGAEQSAQIQKQSPRLADPQSEVRQADL